MGGEEGIRESEDGKGSASRGIPVDVDVALPKITKVRLAQSNKKRDKHVRQIQIEIPGAVSEFYTLASTLFFPDCPKT